MNNCVMSVKKEKNNCVMQRFVLLEYGRKELETFFFNILIFLYFNFIQLKVICTLEI